MSVSTRRQSATDGGKMVSSAGSDSAIRSAVLVCACVWLCVGVLGGNHDIAHGRHNLTLGQRRGWPPYYSDVLLVHDNPRMPSSWMRVRSADICYPRPSLDPSRRFSITAVNVTDLMPRDQGGYVFVDKGGVNSGKLCLHLKTQRGLGYNFTVNIWGFYI